MVVPNVFLLVVMICSWIFISWVFFVDLPSTRKYLKMAHKDKLNTMAIDVIGLDEKQAFDKITAANFRPRVICRDGKNRVTTDDNRNDRINLVVENNKIRSATVG